jgi:hypothetical protein
MSTNDEIQQERTNSFDCSDNHNETSYTDQGINDKIVDKIRSLINLGSLVSTDIDIRVCEQLRSFSDDLTSIESLFDEFTRSDLTGVVNKGAFLCNIIKQWKLRNPQGSRSTTSDVQSGQGIDEQTSSQSRTQKAGPDEIKLKVIRS